MSDPARDALTDAFGLFLTAPPDETFQKKDSLVKSLVLRKTPSRIRYDKDHARILSLPNLNTVTGTQTRVSRINTTARTANALWAGKLIAAAENQSLLKSLWLRYAYDPYLDINPTAKRQLERVLYRQLCGLWCLYPRRKTPSPEALPKALILLDCVIQDAVIECRTGVSTRKTSNTYKAEKMGYGTGKAAYQTADYSRTWAPIERDLRAMLSKLDQTAMEPVSDAFWALTQPHGLSDHSLTQSLKYSNQ